MNESKEQLKKMMEKGYALFGEDFQGTLAYVQINRKLEERGVFDWWKNLSLRPKRIFR